jgi:lysophospholipase L1-like esterase
VAFGSKGVSSGPDAPQRVAAEIMVRDIFIAGLGDSIASGEGNPDRPIALSDEGFCFRSYLGSAAAQYYRPSRAGYKGGRACEAPDSLTVWQRQSALWFNPACHRSLYSYQTRTALALAVRYPHIAVTYLPLACTGATIADGLFGSQRARDCLPSKSGGACQGTINGQLAELREALGAAKRRQPDRKLDLVLLSVGANDIYFSGLVADVIVDTATERALFRRSGVMASVDDARSAMTRDLPQGFAKLREALKPLVGDLSRVVYTSYANPTLSGAGTPCPGGRAGFDIHPAFNADTPYATIHDHIYSPLPMPSRSDFGLRWPARPTTTRCESGRGSHHALSRKPSSVVRVISSYPSTWVSKGEKV